MFFSTPLIFLPTKYQITLTMTISGRNEFSTNALVIRIVIRKHCAFESSYFSIGHVLEHFKYLPNLWGVWKIDCYRSQCVLGIMKHQELSFCLILFPRDIWQQTKQTQKFYLIFWWELWEVVSRKIDSATLPWTSHHQK